jgi:hypothetical protein
VRRLSYTSLTTAVQYATTVNEYSALLHAMLRLGITVKRIFLLLITLRITLTSSILQWMDDCVG